MISILLLSWDRIESLIQTLTPNLEKVGFPYELLICDQGSKDSGVLKFLESKHPHYFRRNSKNEGIAHSFNQLYLRARGEFIAMMSNDILWPENWGGKAVSYLAGIPNSGLASINWGHSGFPPLSKKFGIDAHYLTTTLNRCFGPTIFHRRVVEAVGFQPECFVVYGLDDSDMNERVNRAGFNSFYIPELFAKHICHDVGEDSDYRRMKDESMGKNLALFNQRVAQWDAGGSIREPLPPMRDPI